MVDKELLEAIGQMMDTKLEPINARLDTMQQDIESIKDDVAELKEYAEITREGVSKVAEWADNAGFLLKIPFGKPSA